VAPVPQIPVENPALSASDSGSDSDPSEDNLDLEELEKLQAEIKDVARGNISAPVFSNKKSTSSNLSRLPDPVDDALMKFIDYNNRHRNVVLNLGTKRLVQRTYTGLAVLNAKHKTHNLPPI
jgi:hypothetical protein